MLDGQNVVKQMHGTDHEYYLTQMTIVNPVYKCHLGSLSPFVH